jgi:TolB protein
MSCSVADRTNEEATPLVRGPDLRLTRRRALALCGLAGGLTLSPRFASAVVQLDVSQGNFQPMPIALPDFIAGTGGDGDTARGVTQIITANLKRAACSRRSIPPPTSRRSASVDAVPRFPTGAPSTRRRSSPAA